MKLQKFKNIFHTFNALLATSFYGFPGKKIKVIGVTGTDGKSTTTHLIHHILKSSGKKASMVSSVYAEIAGKEYDTGFHVTTPDPWRLQKFLKKAVDAGQDYMVLEVTSHGIDQNRVLGIDFEIGVITNVTHEHLDYHERYEAYLKTKEKLLKLARVAVVNRDDDSFRYFDISIYRKTVTYALNHDADVTPKKFPFSSPLPGEYNKYNCLAAIAVTKELGLDDTEIKTALKSFTGIKGRLEKFPNDIGLDIIIDFAHTPNAIEQVLSTIKPAVKGKLIHVFGSAGLRDYLKRPTMGKKSAKYADIIVFTEEDYRTEDVNDIIQKMVEGARQVDAVEMTEDKYKNALRSKRTVFFRIPDRQKAINFALQKLARKGDTIILTGKSHEKSLCRGKIEYPWSEHEAVKRALERVN